MKSFVSIFEIPATEISRAIEFYQNILSIDIEKMDFVDMYCENGGNIGELAKYIVDAVVESGLFTQGTPKKEAPMKKKNRR